MEPPLSQFRTAGPLIFVSGQIPRHRDGAICTGSITEQTAIVINNLEIALALAGASLADVVKTTVWLTDASLFGEFNEVYRARFGTPYPARSTVIAGLAVPVLVEIEAIAFRPTVQD
jgi:reactive intermediate/imine deaminase